MIPAARMVLFASTLTLCLWIPAASACDCPEPAVTFAVLGERGFTLLIGEEDRRGDPIRELKLPKDRAEKLRALLDRVRKENRQLSGRLEEQRKELYRQYRAYRYDARRCRRLMNEIRETQDRLIELHHHFQDELRAHLTAPEFETFQKKLSEERKRHGNSGD